MEEGLWTQGCRQGADFCFRRAPSGEGSCQQLCEIGIMSPIFTVKETEAYRGRVRGLPQLTGPEASGADRGG